MNQPMYYTYYVKHLKTGLQYYGVKYGKSADPAKFWKPHGYFTSSKIIKAMVKEEGPEAFRAEVRKIFQSKEEAVNYEQRFLRRVKAPTSPQWLNQAYGTGPYLDKFGVRNTNKGVPKSEEHKRKISEAHKGKKHPRTPEWTAKIAEANRGKSSWNKGVPHSDEARKKMSETRKGTKRGPMSEEAKEKIRRAKLGKKLSEEQKKKISESLTGRVVSDEQKKKVSETLKGREKSMETRTKLSEKAKGRKLPPRSPEHARKISEAHQRRKLQTETTE